MTAGQANHRTSSIPTRTHSRRRSGIGRLELLVVIVLVVCAFVAIPKWLLHNRQTARKHQGFENAHTVVRAITQYYEMHRTFPVVPKPKKPRISKEPRTK
jgi:hypothetical protein